MPALLEAVTDAKAKGAKPLPYPCHLGKPCSCDTDKAILFKKGRSGEMSQLVRARLEYENIREEQTRIDNNIFRALEGSMGCRTPDPPPRFKTPHFRALYTPAALNHDEIHFRDGVQIDARLALRRALIALFKDDSLRPAYLGRYQGGTDLNWTFKHFGYLWDFAVGWA